MNFSKLGPPFPSRLNFRTPAIGIVGIRGRGKSATPGALVEAAVNADISRSDRWWWGLKSSADGKRSGLLAYVFGGEDGDLPLHLDACEVIGSLALEVAVIPQMLRICKSNVCRDRRRHNTSQLPAVKLA